MIQSRQLISNSAFGLVGDHLSRLNRSGNHSSPHLLTVYYKFEIVYNSYSQCKFKRRLKLLKSPILLLENHNVLCKSMRRSFIDQVISHVSKSHINVVRGFSQKELPAFRYSKTCLKRTLSKIYPL